MSVVKSSPRDQRKEARIMITSMINGWVKDLETLHEELQTTEWELRVGETVVPGD